MARIYDNIETKFQDGLKGIISNLGVKRVDFCVGYFNLRGWDVIVDQVDELSGDYVYENDRKIHRICRLLIGMHQPNEELVRRLYSQGDYIPDAEYVSRCKIEIAKDFKNQLLLGLPTSKDQNTLRRLSRQLKDNKVCVKLYLREPLHAKLYLAHRPDDNFNKIQAILGSSNLTYAGLTKQGELNAEFADSDSANKLSKWFDDRWEDRFCLDITDELIKIIDTSWAREDDIPPYYIYLKTAYHLSQEARTGLKEFTINPIFQKELFDFQQTAVKIAARHLNNEKRNGAMIGDVVGLGKTITACAVAKLFEDTYGSSTLIICPANLQEMWKKYVRNYDLKADIISMSKPIDIENSRYYKLIIVDESHNLRNGGKRYQNIKELIHRLDSKVLLLTATPYNKDFSDLSNQLMLFLEEDQDLGIRPEEYIRSLGGERQFMQQHSEVFIRSVKAFEKSQNVEDWNELMRLFLVRRTRSFIKENYAKTDLSNGRKCLQFNDGSKSYFPDRIPKAVKFQTADGDQYSRLYSEEMVSMMDSLKLPRYGLTKYVDESKLVDALTYEKQLIENLSRAGERMMGFCKSTFFKRIDSSGLSYLLTLYRHILRNALFIYAIENKLKLPIGDENVMPEEYLEDDDTNKIMLDEGNSSENVIIEADGVIRFPTDMSLYMNKAKEYYSILSNKSNVSWIDSKYFKRSLKQQLKNDCETLMNMIRLCGDWNPAEDQKLNSLYDLLTSTHGNDKVVVFTQYSDTAQYISRQLKKRGLSKIGCVTGKSANPTEMVEHFSPISNKVSVSADNQYRVLIATDVLSEGQNLQDAHIIVNFDLPWAIIRLIQRAGRVDRIGQESKEIFCYSFFPADGVEKIINLRERLNDRINANANIVGSDEIFFEGNEQNLRDMYNEKNGVLDDDDDSDVDLSSMAYQIWKNATDANPKLKSIIPALSNVVYSTKRAESQDVDGVITYARTHNDFDVLTWLDTNGQVITQSQKRILQAMECEPDEPCIEMASNHFDLVAKAVNDIQNENNTTMSGMLGNRFSTRYRIIQLLEAYYSRPATVFFSEDNRTMLKYAIDDIYNYSLLEQSKYMLGKMLRTSSDDDIVEYVLDMRKSGNLCRIDDNKVNHKDPSIICSMGLKYEA